MSLSYPLDLPSVKTAKSIRLKLPFKVGMSESPFSNGQQTYDWQSEMWSADITLPPMKRANAEQWVGGFLLALHGRAGSFLMGQPGYTTPQGTWSGQSPQVNNEVGSPTLVQTGYSLYIKNLTAASTGEVGDLFQIGSGSSSRLYKLTKGFTADGSGLAQIDFVPSLRASPSHGASITLASPKGVWMLANNDTEWSIEEAMIYGLAFSAVEDLRGI